MSGEGVIPSGLKRGARFASGRETERGDVLAYLRRRLANAALVQSHQPDWAEFASDRRSQLEIVIQEIETGLHLDAAFVEAQLAAGARAEKED